MCLEISHVFRALLHASNLIDVDEGFQKADIFPSIRQATNNGALHMGEAIVTVTQ